MKPFLGIDITENSENDYVNGSELITQKTSEVNKDLFNKAIDSNVELIDKAKMPLPVRILQGACGFIGLILASGMLKAWDTDESITTLYTSAPGFFLTCIACLTAWAVLKLISNKKSKSVIESDEGNLAKSKLDSIVNTIYAELEVPSGTPDTDILSFCYKVKDGEVRPKAFGLESTPYVNLICKVFSDGELLYIANVNEKHSIPLTALKRITTVNKSIMLKAWNKDEGPRKDRYKQYKLSTDNEGNVHAKPFHILEFEHNGEIHGIYFPCYEIEIFEKATGLKAEM